MLTIDRRTALRFLLDWQGLSGARRFVGMRGLLDFARQAGCLQFDPLDVCGRNTELVLNARVQGFTRQMLHDALYKQRTLVDYWDKNMSVFPMADWPMFSREREAYRANPWSRSREEIVPVLDVVKGQIVERGPLFSSDIDLGKRVDWSWSPTSLSRAAMETLYFTGDLVVHHKKGTLRAFDLAERHVPAALFAAPDPFENDAQYEAWRVHRRIGSVGLLWARPSDALLGIHFQGSTRAQAFDTLQAEGRIVPVEITGVSGITEPCFLQSEAAERLESLLQSRAKKKRTEFLAPLDNMLWDRKLIEALFGFYYRWEVYTPVAQRQYGYYVLPVLQGEALVGRIEMVRDRKAKCLRVLGAWWEHPTDPEGVRECLDRHTKLLDLEGWEGDIRC